MSDKYYIPEIEEFHIGFEYEYLKPKSNFDKNPNWKKNVYSLKHNLIDTRLMILKETPYIRVKHLDREDIESLGFELHAENKTNYVGQYYWMKDAELKFGNRTKLETIHLVFQSVNGFMWLLLWQEMNLNIGKVENVRFSGRLKNKSELKRILKQIGV